MDVEQNELRRRLARRQRQKAELERQFHAVQRQYEEEIAPLKEEVLRLQVERLRRAAQRHMRSARHRNAYHDAQRTYEAFRDERTCSHTDSTRDLKAHYRQASKRCHPDKVPGAYRAQAAATFQALEAAYEAGHARAVKAIADALERWGFPRERASAEEEGRTAEELRHAVAALEKSIQALRGTDAYQDLKQAGDLESLFRVRRQELLRHLSQLKRH